ncbi:MAG: FHA domain-containing protein [Xenococcaceae cyanobacterium MO_188.B32]|nr:FHA domain-containing protein [Xenococcaceae cyanobacterium MO_188.B32]
MIICPNCNHHNPDGSTQCENCYTPLPQTTTCPNCGASVQTDATFCGQCGFNLQVETIEPGIDMSENLEAYPELTDTEDTESLPSVPTETMSSPFQSPWDEENSPVTPLETQSLETISWQEEAIEEKEPEQAQFEVHNPWEVEESAKEEIEELPEISEAEDLLNLANSIDGETSASSGQTESAEELFSSAPSFPQEQEDVAQQEEVEIELPLSVSSTEPKRVMSEPPTENFGSFGLSAATQLQLQNAKLLHVQTNTLLDIPPGLAVVHIGKPNSQIPPDIDVSGFANSDIVSRIHADIRVEGDAYFIEDVGSSNGTYINHSPLLVGNRHRLRPGDRISLGKGDLVTFIFQLSEQ